MSKLPTPSYNIDDIVKSNVYEPSEDTFLLLDALESDVSSLEAFNPTLVMEVGPGSGIIITALAKLLKGKAKCFAVDISANACGVTQKTALTNGQQIEVIQSSLLSTFKKNRLIDVLVFNPPYVVTPSEEISKEEVIVRAYAGGKRGREVMDRLFPDLFESLSEQCIFYLLVLKENNPQEIMHILSEKGFTGEVILSRQVPGEKLSVLKLTRNLL